MAPSVFPGGAAGSTGGGTGTCISVALPDGSVLYSTSPVFQGPMLPREVVQGLPPQGTPFAIVLKHSLLGPRNHTLVALPLRGCDGAAEGILVLGFDRRQVRDLLHASLARSLVVIPVVFCCGTTLLILLLKKITSLPGASTAAGFPKKKVFLAMVFVVGASLSVSSTFDMLAFRERTVQIGREKALTFMTLLKRDIEHLLSKNVRLDRLIKMDVLMGEIISAAPELEDLVIFDRENQPLYMAGKEGVMDFGKATDHDKARMLSFMPPHDPDYSLRLDLQSRQGLAGAISMDLSRQAVAEELQKIVLDVLTILFISTLFLVELIILTLALVESGVSPSGQSQTLHYEAIRPAAFLFLFGVDICISFLPLYVESLYEPLFRLSTDMVMGLPISVRLLFTGTAIFWSGTWCDRRSWHEPFLVGLVLSSAGFLYAWIAPDVVHFMFSQALFGLGYGLALMASQGYIIRTTNEGNRAQGFSQLWAGVYAGSICGGAVGAMLAERIGYGPVFLLGAFTVLCIIPYSMVFMGKAMCRQHSLLKLRPPRRAGLTQLLRFLFNKDIFSLILFSSFPAAIALVGFLNYFSPIYLKRMGTSQSSIGRVLMIYGVFLIYGAPLISRVVDASGSRKRSIVVSGILGSLAFLSFVFFQGLTATVVTAVFLGLSSSFGFAAQSAYALSREVSYGMGEGKALGIYSSVNRMGQVLGPIAFGGLIMATGVEHGVIAFGLIYLLATGLFLLLAGSDGRTGAPSG